VLLAFDAAPATVKKSYTACHARSSLIGSVFSDVFSFLLGDVIGKKSVDMIRERMY
jgi:hypothetical protein